MLTHENKAMILLLQELK